MYSEISVANVSFLSPAVSNTSRNRI